MATQIVEVNNRSFPLISSDVSDLEATFVIEAKNVMYSDIRNAFGKNTGDILIKYDDVVMQTISGFVKLVRIIDSIGTFEVDMAKEYDDVESLEIITGGKHPSVDEAKDIRQSLEGMTTYIPDEEAEKDIWAFPAWSYPVAYSIGDRISYNGLLYKVIQAHTSQANWTPDSTPALYVRVNDPGEEWPEWRQPSGAQDAYSLGDKVSHNDKHWISDVNANVWEPGVYGWTESKSDQNDSDNGD